MKPAESKRTVRIFAAASFLNDVGSDIVYSIWPLFVLTFSGANMAVLGLIDGIGDAIVSVSQAFSGYFSDRIKKRKAFIWLGYFLGGVSRIGYAVSAAWQHLIPFRILDRFGKMRGAPRDAMIADVSGKDKGRNFGIVRAFDNLGAVFGILISISLVGILGYRKLFFIAAIPSFIGVMLVLLFVKEHKPKAKIFRGFSLRHLSRDFRLFLLSSSLFALGAFSYSFLLVYSSKAGFKMSLVPALYLVFTLTASIFSFPFGKLSDRAGRKAVIALSFLFWIASCVLFVAFRNYTAVVISFVLYGLHKGALEPVQKAFVSELAPKDLRASSLGAFQMVTGLLALPASVIAGLLWTKVSVSAPFYFAIIMTIVSMIPLMLVRK